jgi:hypothetical protein
MSEEALARENERLRNIILDTLWMARRYADMRSTYAPTVVNEAIDKALKLGIPIADDSTIGRYAHDGMFGNWDANIQEFVKARGGGEQAAAEEASANILLPSSLSAMDIPKGPGSEERAY